ncbi:unnamed protein product [Effrenium voratum]|nr:unnamed protein product [Effrenium voratum]
MPLLQLTKRRERPLRQFLEEYGSRDPHSYRDFAGEALTPIHLAAEIGDGRVVRALLAAGANPSRRTSLGSTAEDLAWRANIEDSHCDILQLLQGQVKVTSLRDAMVVMLPRWERVILSL